MNSIRLLLLTFIAIITSLFFTSTTLLAQEEITIRRIDCETNFPTCTVFSVQDDLRIVNPFQGTVTVDGEPVEISKLTPELVGVQVLLVLDESVKPITVDSNFGLRGAGLSGQPKYVEFERSAVELFTQIQGQPLMPDNTWLGAVRNKDDAVSSLEYIVDWVAPREANVFVNKFSGPEWRPDQNKNSPNPQLGLLTTKAIEAFATVDTLEGTNKPPIHAGRHLILFSDGFEVNELSALDQIVRASQEKNVVIHTVLLANSTETTNSVKVESLRTLARDTGGWHKQFRSEADLIEIWSQIVRDVQQTSFSFEVGSSTGSKLEISIDDKSAERSLSLPEILEPSIKILAPGLTADAPIVRQGAAADTPLQDLSPAEISVEIMLEYPDSIGSVEDRLESIEYELNGTIVEGIDNKSINVNLPIADLDQAEHTLLVRIQDKYSGLVETEPMMLAVQVDRPEAPESTAIAVATEPPVETVVPTTTTETLESTSFIEQVRNWYSTQATLPIQILSALIPLLLLALLASALFRRPQSTTIDTFHTSDPPLSSQYDMTEPDDATEPAADAFPMASLLKIRGDGSAAPEIPLYRQNIAGHSQWGIGRSFEESDVVIDDKRVSRLHATIIEKNGEFTIRDEGSSGGTYITSGTERVRQRLSPLEPVQLKDNDVINFNSIAYRFEIDTNEIFINSPTEPESSPLDTEPESLPLDTEYEDEM